MINTTDEKQETVPTLTMDIATQKVVGEVDRLLSTSPRIVRRYTEHLNKSQGKMIRAVSLLICASDEHGLIHEDAVKVAAAVELLHLATLVHDDIIDNADLRRGKVTLQKKYGKKTAVICGDYLFSVSLQLAASVSNKDAYIKIDIPNFIAKVCMGELSQHINNFNLALSVYAYMKIISGKTAALFAGSFYAGAVIAGAEKEALEKYRRLGHYIGMIFQLTDDFIDFEETVEVAKKPVRSDFEQGVITLPLILAMKQSEDLRKRSEARTITGEEIAKAVVKTGGLSSAKSVSKKYYKKAVTILEELDITHEKRANIMAVLNKAFYGTKLGVES